MCTLIEAYRHGSSLSNNTDVQIQFIEFLTEFTKEEVEYGISFIKRTEPTLYEMLLPMILDYRTYGLANFEEPEEVNEGEDKNSKKNKNINGGILYKLNSIWCFVVSLFNKCKDTRKKKRDKDKDKDN